MSLIPLDDRRGDGEPTPQDGDGHTSGVGRLWGHLKTLVTRLSGRLRPRERRDTDDRTTPVLALPADSTGQVEAVGTADEQPELVSTEREETLTVSVVDNAEASVTSDTWVRVEQ